MHFYLNLQLNPWLFSIKMMLIVFTFITEVETWYSNLRKMVKFKVVKCIRYTVSMLCLKLSIEKENTILVLSVSRVVLYWKVRDFTLNIVGVIPLFCQISDGGTWYLKYWVHDFEGIGVQGAGYIVSHYPMVIARALIISLIIGLEAKAFLTTLTNKPKGVACPPRFGPRGTISC